MPTSTAIAKTYATAILGTGAYLPERILTNIELEKMVDTTDEWIKTRTGILERRLAEKETATSDMAAEAARRALKAAGVSAKDLELIIVATITPDMQFPSTACLVQDKIGATKAAAFDVGAACAGFIYALELGNQFIRSGTYKQVLVVGAEKLSSITDWSDRSTCILFGDGAGAAVLGRGAEGHGILCSSLASNGGKAEILKIPAGGSRIPASHESVAAGLHFLKMEGKEVFKEAVSSMGNVVVEALACCGCKPKDIGVLIPHQANARIIQAVAKRLELTEEKIHLNVHKFGNMSSASTAVGLDEVVRSKKLKKGDLVVLVGFGSGLVWGAMVIKW